LSRSTHIKIKDMEQQRGVTILRRLNPLSRSMWEEQPSKINQWHRFYPNQLPMPLVVVCQIGTLHRQGGKVRTRDGNSSRRWLKRWRSL